MAVPPVWRWCRHKNCGDSALTVEYNGPNFHNIAKELDKLNHYMVAVGFFGDKDAKLLAIVRANEYGAYITPKKGKYLMVPKGKKPSDGYYKLKSVHIPPRPFIRNAWNDNKQKYKRYIVVGMGKIIAGKMTAMKLLNQLGTMCVADIRNSAIRLSKPRNARLTVERKGSANPLVDTGELERKVTYKIIPG